MERKSRSIRNTGMFGEGRKEQRREGEKKDMVIQASKVERQVREAARAVAVNLRLGAGDYWQGMGCASVASRDCRSPWEDVGDCREGQVSGRTWRGVPAVEFIWLLGDGAGDIRTSPQGLSRRLLGVHGLTYVLRTDR